MELLAHRHANVSGRGLKPTTLPEQSWDTWKRQWSERTTRQKCIYYCTLLCNLVNHKSHTQPRVSLETPTTINRTHTHTHRHGFPAQLPQFAAFHNALLDESEFCPLPVRSQWPRRHSILLLLLSDVTSPTSDRQSNQSPSEFPPHSCANHQSNRRKAGSPRAWHTRSVAKVSSGWFFYFYFTRNLLSFLNTHNIDKRVCLRLSLQNRQCFIEQQPQRYASMGTCTTVSSLPSLREQRWFFSPQLQLFINPDGALWR